MEPREDQPGRIRVHNSLPSRRRALPRRPSIEVLEGRALMAVGFSPLPFEVPGSFTTGADSDFYYGSGDQIDRISPAGVVTRFTTPSQKDVEAVSTGPDGNIWFAEYGGFAPGASPSSAAFGKIGRITPSGTITEFALPAGTTPSQGKYAADIQPGPGGDVWFVEIQEAATSGQPPTAQIARITPSGQITEFTAPGLIGSFGNANHPSVIVGAADANIWYTEPGVGKIGRISPSGVVSQFAIPGNLPAIDITAGPDGNVWFVETNGVGRITPSGFVSLFAAPIDSFSMYTDYAGGRITGAPDGNVWFIEPNGVGRVTPAGVVSDFVTPTSGTEPSLIGIGPQHALLYTTNTPATTNNLETINTNALTPPPVVTATPETTPQGEVIATVVARFTSTDNLTTLANYQAVVSWGPTQTVAGIIRPDPAGGFDVYATDLNNFTYGYDEPASGLTGPYPVTISIFDARPGGASMTTVTGTLVVTPGPGVGVSPVVTFGPHRTATAVGVMTEDGTLPANSYSATINFGDGSPTLAATVTAVSGFHSFYPDSGGIYETRFTATSTHQYTHPGGYAVTVAFRDKAGNVLANDTLVIDLD